MKRIGLFGYPNVGKSSIFQILTNKNVLIANYPFSTINPNVSFLEFHDKRTVILKDLFQSKKITLSSLEIVDIAGIIKGASQKVGLGGEFLSHIRDCDLICHVLRCFKNDDIMHVESRVDPIKDFENIQLEFIIADIQQSEKRLEKIENLLKKEKENNNNLNLKKEKEVLNKLLRELKKEIQISKIKNLENWEIEIIKKHNFLSIKPAIIIANYDGEDYEEVQKLKNTLKDLEIVTLSVNLEREIKDFSYEEVKEFGWKSFDWEKFSNSIKKALNLKVFFTAGKSESRNWIVESEADAAKCAGLIHSDIQNNFIKLEVYNFNEIEGNEIKKNILRKEPANYIVKDGDICNFLFNK